MISYHISSVIHHTISKRERVKTDAVWWKFDIFGFDYITDAEWSEESW
jgi:hypothetical protein